MIVAAVRHSGTACQRGPAFSLLGAAAGPPQEPGLRRALSLVSHLLLLVFV